MNKGWLLQEIGRAIGSSIRDTFDRQYAPGEGMCSDDLALTLTIFGVAIFVGILFAS